MGLASAALPGAALPDGAFPIVALPVLLASILVARRAPLGAAIGIMVVAGTLWGTAAAREHGANCAGRWSRERGAGSRGAIVRLADPVDSAGGQIGRASCREG